MQLKPLNAIFILILIISVSGCGFKLRGTAEPLPEQIRQLILVGDKGSDFYQALTHALIGAGANLEPTEGRGESATLTIHKVTQSRDEVSVSGGQTLYRANLSVTFTLRRDKQLLIDSRRFNSSYEFSFDSNNPYGLEQQDILFRGELQRDLIQQMIRQIRAAGSDNTPNKGSAR